jgi:hypothetical protein
MAAAVFALSALTARSAPATTVSFNDFSDTTGLTLNGSATPASTNDGMVLRLTPETLHRGHDVGLLVHERAAELVHPVALLIHHVEPGGATDAQGQQGADGFVFVVQPVSSSIGGAGSGLGYSGIN